MNFDILTQQAIETIADFLNLHPKGNIIIRGATATGKTKLSLLLAEKFSLEVISSDSRQIFKKMDIGTDKIPAEIRAKIPLDFPFITNTFTSLIGGI